MTAKTKLACKFTYVNILTCKGRAYGCRATLPAIDNLFCYHTSKLRFNFHANIMIL